MEDLWIEEERWRARRDKLITQDEKTEFGLEQDGQNDAIKTFDKLWAEGLISEDPVKAGQIMRVDGTYLDSFITWYVELGDLEYTPWIEKYQS